MDQNQENGKPPLTAKEQLIRSLKIQSRISTFSAFVVASGCLYVMGSIENGGRYSVSSKEKVEAAFNKAVADNPKLNTPMYKEELRETGKDAERGTALICALLSLWGGFSMTRKSWKYTAALGDQPRPPRP